MLTDNNLSWKKIFPTNQKEPQLRMIDEEVEPVLKINTNLLKPPEVTKYKNRLIEDSKHRLLII